MTKYPLIAVSLVLVCMAVFSGCDKSGTDLIPDDPTLALTPSTSPIAVPQGTTFYGDVSYDKYAETKFDIFLPASGQPTGMLIKIHGGGFRAGDKTDDYTSSSSTDKIKDYLDNKIAYATLNYRLLLATGEQEGVLKPLNDCRRALQFIRYYSKFFNIEKSKIVLQGGSAGAGTSLWIGLNNDMAVANSSDPVERESTRVKGIVANSTQATYDVLSWPTAVFSVYPQLTTDAMLEIGSEDLVLRFYGISDTSELSSPEITAYRKKVDMLGLMSADDPEIYVSSSTYDNVIPNNLGSLEHHPLHAKAVMDKATAQGIANKAFIPKLGINTTNNEEVPAFVMRKINN